MSGRRVRKWAVRGIIAAALFYTPIHSVNPASRLALVDSLLSRGTPATAGSRFFNPVDMVYFDGHFYSDKPPLLALYSTAAIAPVHGPLNFDGGVSGKILYWLVVATASGAALLALVLLARALHRRAGGRLSWTWLAAAMVAGTCVLPFVRTYNDHIVEAAVLLGLLALLRSGSGPPRAWRPLAAGALVGVSWLLHPLVGTVAALTTGLYFLARGGGGTAVRRVVAAATFSVGALAVAGLGTAVHVAMYDRAVPFYFSPELYLWTGGPGGVESHWLSEPTTPGLTADRITSRFAELGLPEDRLDETLARFEAHRASVRGLFPFTLERLFRYGQLTFNPLVLFCLVLAAASLLGGRPRSGSPEPGAPPGNRSETAWVLATAAGLFAASLVLRSVPGGSFGDRHLLPAVPLIVAAGGLAVASAREAGLFRVLALLSLTMMLPGAIAPWVTPGDPFLALNLGASAGVVAGAIAVWRASEGSRADRAWHRLQSWLSERRAFLVVTCLAIGEVALYLATLPS